MMRRASNDDLSSHGAEFVSSITQVFIGYGHHFGWSSQVFVFEIRRRAQCVDCAKSHEEEVYSVSVAKLERGRCTEQDPCRGLWSISRTTKSSLVRVPDRDSSSAQASRIFDVFNLKRSATS